MGAFCDKGIKSEVTSQEETAKSSEAGLETEQESRQLEELSIEPTPLSERKGESEDVRESSAGIGQTRMGGIWLSRHMSKDGEWDKEEVNLEEIQDTHADWREFRTEIKESPVKRLRSRYQITWFVDWAMV
jgi:hypothetical protein